MFFNGWWRGGGGGDVPGMLVIFALPSLMLKSFHHLTLLLYTQVILLCNAIFGWELCWPFRSLCPPQHTRFCRPVTIQVQKFHVILISQPVSTDRSSIICCNNYICWYPESLQKRQDPLMVQHFLSGGGFNKFSSPSPSFNVTFV